MKINSVQATWVHVPIPYERQHVSDFGRVASFDSVIVKIEADGLVGWGEAKAGVGSSASAHGLAAIINRDYAPLLVGRDPRDVSRLWDVMYNTPREGYALDRGHVLPQLGRRGLSISAIAGVDLALWDLLGKSLDAPVWRLLGGRRAGACRRMRPAAGPTRRTSASSSRATWTRAASAPSRCASASWTVSRARSAARVRGAPGPRTRREADGRRSRYLDRGGKPKRSAAWWRTAISTWLEEPVTADDKTGLAEVRRSSAIPISTGEARFTRHDFREIAELRGADVLQPDLAIAGGITEGVRIGAIAAAYNLRLAPHLWSGAPAFAAGVALAASQTTGFILEVLAGRQSALARAGRGEVSGGRRVCGDPGPPRARDHRRRSLRPALSRASN